MELPSDLQKLHLIWLQNAVQFDQAHSRALESYSLGLDKWLATAAGVRAMGMDPRQVPPFGWNMPLPPNVDASHTTTITGGAAPPMPSPLQPQYQPAPIAPVAPSAGKPAAGWLLKTALSAFLLMTAAGGGAVLLALLTRAPAVQTPAPAPAPPPPAVNQPQRWKISWEEDDSGTINKKIEPVPIPEKSK